MIDVRITGLDESLASLMAALDGELADGMHRAAAVVAEEAASSHPYTNRTGDLEQRTVAGSVSGRASDGEITAEVLGDTEYGEYVDRKPSFAFLEPAYQRAEAQVEATIEQAMQRAADRAGW